ncbi:MAG: purine-binding chemotaxis protein CheW [Aquificae bacterium]|nr:purine-binding chemotaxis protein CheW [Aquificota bacterium]
MTMEIVGIKEIYDKPITKEQRLIAFKLNNELVGVDITDVVKITKTTDITPVPKTPDHVLGVMNLRGNIIPVVTLKKKLGLNDTGGNIEEKIIVVVDTDLGYIGCLVDQIDGAIMINSEEILPPPMNSIGIDPEFIKGVVMVEKNGNKELLIILDITKIFKNEE